jgi:hypothetical protein
MNLELFIFILIRLDDRCAWFVVFSWLICCSGGVAFVSVNQSVTIALKLNI